MSVQTAQLGAAESLPSNRMYHPPMPLLATFRDEARRRGLLGADETIDAARAFALVRDMPYRRASSRDPQVTTTEWTGTCSGKHYLLQALLEELGLATMLIVCTHEFTIENSPWLPPELLALRDIDRHDSVREAGLLEEHHHLVAVGRGPEMKVDHGGLPPPGQAAALAPRATGGKSTSVSATWLK